MITGEHVEEQGSCFNCPRCDISSEYGNDAEKNEKKGKQTSDGVDYCRLLLQYCGQTSIVALFVER